MEMEAEIGVLLPEAEESMGSPEAGEGEEEFSSPGFEESMALLTTRFWISSL